MEVDNRSGDDGGERGLWGEKERDCTFVTIGKEKKRLEERNDISCSEKTE